MARPREFDPDKVLGDAMNVFWQHGYDAASLPALLKGMGMTRGSLYKAFTDKKSLFLRVLTRYENEAVQPAVDILTTGPADGLDRIKALFDSIVSTAKEGDRRGCLLCSAAAGPAAFDPEIATLVHLKLRLMEDAFTVAASQANALSSLTEDEQRDAAALLLTHYVGLRVMIRSNASMDTIISNAKALNAIINSLHAR